MDCLPPAAALAGSVTARGWLQPPTWELSVPIERTPTNAESVTEMAVAIGLNTSNEEAPITITCAALPGGFGISKLSPKR